MDRDDLWFKLLAPRYGLVGGGYRQGVGRG